MQVTSWLVLVSFILNTVPVAALAQTARPMPEVLLVGDDAKRIAENFKTAMPEEYKELQASCHGRGKSSFMEFGETQPDGTSYMVRGVVAMVGGKDDKGQEFESTALIDCAVFGYTKVNPIVGSAQTRNDTGCPNGECRNASPAEDVNKAQKNIQQVVAAAQGQAPTQAAAPAANACTPEKIASAKAKNNAAMSCIFGSRSPECTGSPMLSCFANAGRGIMDNIVSNIYGIPQLAAMLAKGAWWLTKKTVSTAYNVASGAATAAARFIGFGGESPAPQMEDKSATSGLVAALTTEGMRKKLAEAGPDPTAQAAALTQGVLGGGWAVISGMGTMISESIRTAYLCDEWKNEDGSKVSNWRNNTRIASGVSCAKYKNGSECLSFLDMMQTPAACGAVGYIAGEAVFGILTGAVAAKGVSLFTRLSGKGAKAAEAAKALDQAAVAATRGVARPAQAAADAAGVVNKGGVMVDTSKTVERTAEMAKQGKATGKLIAGGRAAKDLVLAGTGKAIRVAWKPVAAVGRGVKKVADKTGVSWVTDKTLGAYMRLTDDAFFVGYYGVKPSMTRPVTIGGKIYNVPIPSFAPARTIRDAKAVGKNGMVAQHVVVETKDGAKVDQVLFRTADSDAFRAGDIVPESVETAAAGGKVVDTVRVTEGDKAWKEAYYAGMLQNASESNRAKVATEKFNAAFWRNPGKDTRVELVTLKNGDDVKTEYVVRHASHKPPKVGDEFAGAKIEGVKTLGQRESEALAVTDSFRKAVDERSLLVTSKDGQILRNDYPPIFYHRTAGGDVLASRGATGAGAAASASNEVAEAGRAVAKVEDGVVPVDSDYIKRMEKDFDDVAKAEAKMDPENYDTAAWSVTENHVQTLGKCTTDDCLKWATDYLKNPKNPLAGRVTAARAMYQWDPARLPWDDVIRPLLLETRNADNPRLARVLSEMVAEAAPTNPKALEIAFDGLKRSLKSGAEGAGQEKGRFLGFVAGADMGVVKDYYRAALPHLNDTRVKEYVKYVEPRIVKAAKEEAELNKWVNGKLIVNKIEPIDHKPISDLIREMGDKGWTPAQIRQRVEKALRECGGKG